ncbi:hypothetical protein ACFLT5_02870 [Chloroflexota bacterium]
MLLTAFIGYLALSQGEVSASAPQAPLASSTGMRQNYLTTLPYSTAGAGADACADPYHFASMWEILDPSNLRYNTSLGLTKDDCGQGPTSDKWGFVRTGNVSSSDDTVGTGNCDSWTVSATIRAPQAKLDSSWDTTGDFPGWVVENTWCDFNR